MRKSISKKIYNILACPNCGNSLSRKKNGFKCSNCQEEYTNSNKGQPDLRLRKEKIFSLKFKLGTTFLPEKSIEFGILQKNPTSQVDFTKIDVPKHATKELLSYFPKATNSQSISAPRSQTKLAQQEHCLRKPKLMVRE